MFEKYIQILFDVSLDNRSSAVDAFVVVLYIYFSFEQLSIFQETISKKKKPWERKTVINMCGLTVLFSCWIK